MDTLIDLGIAIFALGQVWGLFMVILIIPIAVVYAVVQTLRGK